MISNSAVVSTESVKYRSLKPPRALGRPNGNGFRQTESQGCSFSGALGN